MAGVNAALQYNAAGLKAERRGRESYVRIESRNPAGRQNLQWTKELLIVIAARHHPAEGGREGVRILPPSSALFYW